MTCTTENLRSFFMPLVVVVSPEILINQSVCVHASMLSLKRNNALDRMNTSSNPYLNRT